MRDRARAVAEAVLAEQVVPELVIPIAQQLLGIDRAHEGAWRAIMRAHAERGERGLAVQAYDRCKAALIDLMDAMPSPETQRLIAESAPATCRPSSAQGSNPPRRTPPGRPWRRQSRRAATPTRRNRRGRTASSLGLAEEVTAALARFRWMFLVSSSSLAQFGSRDETALRRSFGLDFLLDGSVQRVARRLRVTMRLLDLREGNQIVWARRFDRQMNDLLSLQDEIAAEVVAQIDPEILLIEAAAPPSAPHRQHRL